MNEWLQRTVSKLKDLWAKWKPVQKVILFGIIAVVIIAVVAAAKMSAKPSTVRLFNAPVTDENSLYKILDRLDKSGITASTDDAGYIYVADEKTKRRIIPVLNDENLIPSNVDIWGDYFTRNWSTTDADQKVKYQKKKEEELRKFIESYSDIDHAEVSVPPVEEKLFKSDQNPQTCSVILYPSSGSSILKDRKRLEGLQRAILAAVPGLTQEFLIITDSTGAQVNNFEDMADLDRLSVTERTEKAKLKLATEIRAKILNLFQQTYTQDRCRDMAVTIEMDTSQKTTDSKEYFPIEIKADNPDTPYDDSEFRDYLPRSTQSVTETWQGTGYNPEGPAGAEGENSPVYADMSNVIGTTTRTGLTQNNELNSKETHEITAPKIDRVSVSVNLDGKWRIEKDNQGNFIVEDGALKRHYDEIPAAELSKAEDLIKGAIGYNRERGDLVHVTNIQYDRTDQFKAEDDEYFAAIQRRRTLLMILVAVAVVLIGFIMFRVISRELERRRREREARLLAEQQAARERALWEAKDDGMEVTMSVEETRRMELQENAINMAKEHPEDVAMLIRTWLMEE